jgi:ornithine lipid ester-linked acyl 2-hydroxylase
MTQELTDKNPFYFYNSSDFPYLNPLVNQVELIKQELKAVLSQQNKENWMATFPHYVDSVNPEAWKVFTFIFFGMKSKHHAALCPKTAEILYAIPEIVSCDYSYLKPHTHILPHKGYTRMVLRCHLPLIVPKGNLCGLRVGDQTHYWEEGKLVIFDDSYEHEAWNNSDEQRVVLMFDIPNPRWGYSAHEISKYKIENLDDPFLLSIAPKEIWMTAFEKGVSPMELND